MYYGYDIEEKLIDLVNEAEVNLKKEYKKYDDIALLNSAKVLSAFQNEKVGANDFNETTGYACSDQGREKLERIYASIFKAEDALVRAQIMSGTHALYLTLSALLKYNDVMVSISGEPYDSLKTMIGLTKDSNNSLMKNGIKYEQIDLVNDDFDDDKIIERVKKGNIKLIEIQRSRGYSSRRSLTISKIARIIKKIREVDNKVIIMVDNCYGDFVEEREPIEVGADIIVSSLMKNLGGGIAKTGGYIVGRKDLINDVSERLTSPGIGKDLGPNLNQNREFYKGLFMAPSVVASSLKTMTLSAYMLEKLGYETNPRYDEERTDLVQILKLNTLDNMVNFCKGIQMACPVDSYVSPIPFDMPGYPDKIVMASGSFTDGSTIELSCDGPCKEPYYVYMQGGLTYEYGKLGILLALNKMIKG